MYLERSLRRVLHMIVLSLPKVCSRCTVVTLGATDEL